MEATAAATAAQLAFAEVQAALIAVKNEAAELRAELEALKKKRKVKVAEPSVFSGRANDVHNWLFEIENACEGLKYEDDDERIRYAVGRLGKDGTTWWRGVKDNFVWSWEEFKAAFIKAHVPIDPEETARDRLDRLRQGTHSATQYAQAFRRIVLEIPTLSEADRIHRFTSGLRRDIAQQVRIQDPQTLEEAMAIAARADDPKHPFKSNFSNTSSYRASSPAPMELGVHRSLDVKAIQKRYRLGYKDLLQLMDEQKCFKCRQAGHIAKFCPVKKTFPSKN